MSKINNDKLIKALCRSELLIMGPVPSVNLRKPLDIPLHFSSRRIYAFPSSLETIAQETSKIVKKLKVNRIIGGETAGIPLVAIASLKSKIPMSYVRKKIVLPPRYPVEGIINNGDKVALFDDSIVCGECKKNFIQNIESLGAKVTDIVTIWDCSTKGISGKQEMEKMGIKVHSLITWYDWFYYMGKLGYISKELTKIALDFIKDPYCWSESKNNWRKFNKVVKEQNGKFI